MSKKWVVKFHSEFEKEFDALTESVQDELLAKAYLLEEYGFMLGRPHVDTLKGSDFSNMKELRFSVNSGIWRIAFAFDPKQRAILLVAGNKKGKNQKQFYTKLISHADKRYKQYLDELE